jgi:hypothetical protein
MSALVWILHKRDILTAFAARVRAMCVEDLARFSRVSYLYYKPEKEKRKG